METKKITVRLNPQQYKHLKKQCEISGLKMEPTIRMLLMKLDLRPRPPEQCGALLRELSAIGNNVNQIAHVANSTKRASDCQIEELSKLIHAAWRIVRDTL